MECKYPCERSEVRSFSLALEFFKALGRQEIADRMLSEGARVALEVPMDYSEPDTVAFRDAYWASEAFSKTPWTLPGVNREETAYSKFEQAEEACRVANSRLVDWENRPHLSVKLLRRARQFVHSVLGDFSWDDCVAHFSFGPGASTSLPRRRAQRPNKWLGGHITENCLPVYLAFARYHTGWESVPVTLVAGNTVTTVPKNAKTDRVIAIEPDWNMFFQRGLGGLIRHKVRKRCGLLKPDAQDVHKRLARQGSLDGSLATIDLQAASDSVSLALVELLCPDSWVRAFYTTRSPEGRVQGKRVVYEKISSMGNGFTFELETLLFWALSKACTEHSDTLSVYGDDIIVSTSAAEKVISLLTEVGLTINKEKTFIDGPFRESCGGHFHKGHEVTPPYFRKFLTSSMPSRIRHANLIRERSSQRVPFGLDGRFEALWWSIARQVPRRFYGPESLGDAVLHMSFAETKPRPAGGKKSRRKPWFQSHFQVMGLIAIREDSRADHLGGMYSSIWGVVSEESQFKTGIGLYRTGTLSVERWEDPAPWLGAELFW